MKQYFSYANGYIHLLDDYLIFTRSGNWQEAREAQEWSNNRNRYQQLRSFRIWLFISITVVGGLALFVLGISEFSLLPIILGIGAAFGIYQYMHRETGPSFRIHKVKISEVSEVNGTVYISFYVGSNLRNQDVHGLSPNDLEQIRIWLNS